MILLMVGGVFSSQVVEHSFHHSHHEAKLHATMLCIWTCAAAHGVETIHIQIGDSTENSHYPITVFPHYLPGFKIHSVSRGPPLFDSYA